MGSDQETIRQAIREGRTAIGIELGSTRIKTILTGPDYFPVAAGSFDWENSQVNGIWTYDLDMVWQGIQTSFANMKSQVRDQYGLELETAGSIGFSGMMHGYVALDSEGELLVPFRTWRNNITGTASEALTQLFDYPIPQRWSIAHLYQAILNGEHHVARIDYLTTLAGYVHWRLTGRRVMGVGEASGMFPIDLATHSFNQRYAAQFDDLVRTYQFPWKLLDILPDVLVAGERAGELTADGARLLDVSGHLRPGIPFCPPEGDAGTGMVATNSVAVRTGNVSAGTSVFAMLVLEHELSRAYPEIDLVTTPDGHLVAMVHSNNCTSDYDALISLFGELARELGVDIPKARLYDTLLTLALRGDPDCGGLLSYGYVSGEHITHFTEGRPLFVRTPQSHFNLANFMRVNLFTPFGALRTGLNILFEQEGVEVDEIRGHGGFFKTREVGQKIMAAATTVPISVMDTAGEGGAWGIALLAAYMLSRKPDESLTDFLNHQVFAGLTGTRVEPDPRDIAGYNEFMKRYTEGLAIERAAVEHLR
jgi:sugar (pentulose or hexulose) kinase